jgi:hypothetical protein
MNVSVNLKFALTVVAVLVVICVAMLMHGLAQDEPKQPVKPSAPVSAPADPPKVVPVYKPTLDQEKDLKIDQLAAQLAQSQLAAKEQTFPEFNQFQQSMTALRQQCARVIAANKWPATVQCDVQSIPVRFCEGSLPCAVTPTAAAATDAPKPASASTPTPVVKK